MRFLVNFILKIPSLRKRDEGVFKNHRWENGGKEPAAHPTFDVKFKSY